MKYVTTYHLVYQLSHIQCTSRENKQLMKPQNKLILNAAVIHQTEKNIIFSFNFFFIIFFFITFDGDDELGDDREDLRAAVLQHVVDALAREELVRVGVLAQAVEKQRQVVVVVQLLDLNLKVIIYGILFMLFEVLLSI